MKTKINKDKNVSRYISKNVSRNKYKKRSKKVISGGANRNLSSISLRPYRPTIRKKTSTKMNPYSNYNFKNSLGINNSAYYTSTGQYKGTTIDKIFKFYIDQFNHFIDKYSKSNNSKYDDPFNIYLKRMRIVFEKKSDYFKFIYYDNINYSKNIIQTIYVYPKNGNTTILYPSNNKMNQNLYIIEENTNQNITIIVDHILEKIINITPLELSVDTMQLAINNNLIQISEDENKDENENKNTYLGFINFPSLVVNKGITTYKSSRVNAEWYNVYEDNTTFEENKLYKKKEVDLNYEDKFIQLPIIKVDLEFTNNQNFINIRHKIQIINDILKQLKLKQVDTIKAKIDTLFLSYIKQNESQIIITPDVKSYFNKRKSKIVELIDELMSNFTELKLTELEVLLNNEKDFLYYFCYYGNTVKIEDDSSKNNTYDITENISWVIKNSLWLEKYLEIKTEDNSLTSEYLKSKIGEEYECDLSGLDEKYIIVDEIKVDGEEYVICGYPDKQMKDIILNFWQDENMSVLLDEIHNGNQNNKIDTIDLLIDLYNYYNKNDLIDKKNKHTDLFKLFNKTKTIFNYLNILYSKYYKNKDQTQYNIFNEKWLDNANNYYNKIAQNYMKKIITKIKYIFLVFNKNYNKTFIPFIFNIKELDKKHKLILERINKLIKNKLPSIFNIQDEYNSINKYDTPEYIIDKEYKLFYSKYEKGNFFYIETEYLHSMNNISQKDYKYNNTTTLDELIYACSIFSDTNSSLSFLKKLIITYKIREYKLNFFNINKITNQNNILNLKLNKDCKTKSRSNFIYCKYETMKKVNNSKKVNNTTNLLINKLINFNKNIKIILIFKSNIQEYTIIYKYIKNENEYIIYKLIIVSNIKNLIDDIINKLNLLLNKIILSKHINFNNLEKPKLFKIVSCEILNDKDHKKIFTYNPAILYYINQNKINNKINNNTKKEDIINTAIYYENALLKNDNTENISSLINLYNFELYKIYPILIQNFVKDDYYKSEITNDKITCNNRLVYEETFKGCTKKDCEGNSFINCVHYNINECGYNFVEIIDNHAHKIVIHIIPSNLDTNKQTHKFLGNITDLDTNSKQMITELYNLYKNKNMLIFCHVVSNPEYICLHFHIIKTDIYNREKHFTNKGSYMFQDIFIEDIINKLNINSNYYKTSNFKIIRQQ